jgi:hypothetical protein
MNPNRLLAALVLPLSACAAPADFMLQRETSKLRSPAITEASGMAASPSRSDLLWIVNDSGGTPDIHLAATDGTDHGKLTLKDTLNIDWEDLASFMLAGKSYLLVADTGDNASHRGSCVLHIVPEPVIPACGETLAVTRSPAWSIRFRYEDGPRDCEAVAVDVKAGTILLISKRTEPPAVYELPLRPADQRGTLTARRIGTTAAKAPGSRLLRLFDQPTGLDISADGSLAAIVTYHGAFLFPRDETESWAQAFARTPVALQPHRLGQAEAVAFSVDGQSLRLVSEGKGSPIRIYQR